MRLAQHAYTLLMGWKGPIPGATGNTDVDASGLRAWVTNARKALTAADRLEIGDQRIGHALWYAPVGSDGIHPHEAVRTLIQDIASANLDLGFRIEAVNSRGAVFRGHGGDQERELAADYRARADALAASYPATARLYRDLADDYERQARFEDEQDLARDP